MSANNNAKTSAQGGFEEHKEPELSARERRRADAFRRRMQELSETCDDTAKVGGSKPILHTAIPSHRPR